jgi:hypothetical protein
MNGHKWKRLRQGRPVEETEWLGLNLWKNQLMPVRVTIEIPQTLQEELRKRAESTGTSMRSLIVRAIESRTPGCQG